ncbi:anthranilate synthase family protein [Streptomyces sp. JJ36]|uniref:anthranilate synthase family protein n=1 Tax=Streptomyces sp. JJ36 TaxID=2736645 RepID=UPI001F2B05D8|nr:anthranilate synthase family protein [Streptomyces sp. JJ36]MCF6524112.1 chorismate-binding protein [Streptomyces sp. JJ36]
MTGPAGGAAPPDDLLARVLDGRHAAYALLHRPETAGRGLLEVVAGEAGTARTLADVPLPGQDAAATAPGGAVEPPAGGPRHDVLALVPYRQLAERGFDAPDDGAPLLTVTVAEQQTLALAEALPRLPDEPIEVTEGGFDVSDEEYAATVKRVVTDEIGTGKGANFVIKRSFVADITGYTPRSALTFFRRLLEREAGAYWTFLVRTRDRTLVGASPERHVSLHDGTAVMNPVSGTYRYPAGGPSLPEVMDFLADRKEADELYMVVDEELKMMARFCPEGGRVEGPYLKEMARLAHTEYVLTGRSDRDVREILRETLLAPTVTGSPLESAARVLARYEPEGRGYYSGVAALIGRDAAGARTLDSAILIRTADIDRRGRVRIGVGATLVRHSDPLSEVAETRAKAAGLLAALTERRAGGLGGHPTVRAALERRNATLAGFWLAPEEDRTRVPVPGLAGRRVLVVDAEDTFTAMIAHQLRSLGPEVTVRRFDEPHDTAEYDLVVMGPGPGDPRDLAHPKIAHLHATLRRMLHTRQPFLAVCLSHQVLGTLLGFDLIRRDVPNQGVQRTIDLFGERVRVGFYNTFAARSEEDKAEVEGVGVVEVSRDADSGEVHALRGPGFASMQFHAESLLTEDGPHLTAGLLREVLGT